MSAYTSETLNHNHQGEKFVRNKYFNKGNAFTNEERKLLQIEGLHQASVVSLEDQMKLVLFNLDNKKEPFEKYLFLRSVMDLNETLFYYTLTKNVTKIMPIVYTPTVGEACIKYSTIIAKPRGIFLNFNQRGRLSKILSELSGKDFDAIVVTDGERILGLGDLGANGHGIPVGKLTLYSACAGVSPKRCLPVTLDVGTNNEQFLKDPFYKGLRQKRLKPSSKEYNDFIHEFVTAVKTNFPNALLQWEDFGNANAFRLLKKYRNEILSFNDDIQGTACVVLSALISAAKLIQIPLQEQKFLFLGAGEAGVGIGDLISYSLVESGKFKTIEDARKHCFFVDSRGLVCKSRVGKNLVDHKLHYAHDVEYCSTLLEAIKTIKPTAIIGVSAQPNTFTREVVEAMSTINKRPIIFALSNPTSKAECTAEQAYQWSNGSAVFASGSPFPIVKLSDGRIFKNSQANNSFIFPGVALGVIASRAKTIPDKIFLIAAECLANLACKKQAEKYGLILPKLEEIRQVSFEIAVQVAKTCVEAGNTRLKKIPQNEQEIKQLVKDHIFIPSYKSYANSKL